MYTTEFSCYGVKQRHSNLLGFLLAMAIIPLVFYGVLLYAGPKAPPEMKGTENYYLIATAVFTVLYVGIYFLVRFKVDLYGDERTLRITVHDRSRTVPLELGYPFRISRQWAHQHTGRRVKMKLLYLTLFDRDNKPVMTFTGALGAAYEAPAGFEYVDTLNAEDRQNLVLAEDQYSSKVRAIDDELKIHIKYLEGKKRA